MPEPQPPYTDGAYSPTSGCIIMVLAVLILGGMAVFFIVQGFRMNREIDTFTESQPVPHAVATPDAAERDALRERVRSFGRKAVAGDFAELSLSAGDINNLIAFEPVLRDFRGNTEVVEIAGEFLVAEMSQTLNSLRPGRQRYLNATFHFRPRNTSGEFDLALVDISESSLEIPRGFIELYIQKNYFKPDPDHPSIGPVLKRITLIEIRGDKLVIASDPSLVRP